MAIDYLQEHTLHCAQMTPKKLRLLVSGLLLICLARLFWQGSNVPGLTDLFASAGAWACVVWLWTDNCTHFVQQYWLKVAIGICTIIVILGCIFAAAGWERWSLMRRYGISEYRAARLLQYLEKRPDRKAIEDHMSSASKADIERGIDSIPIQ